MRINLRTKLILLFTVIILSLAIPISFITNTIMVTTLKRERDARIQSEARRLDAIVKNQFDIALIKARIMSQNPELSRILSRHDTDKLKELLKGYLDALDVDILAVVAQDSMMTGVSKSNVPLEENPYFKIFKDARSGKSTVDIVRRKTGYTIRAVVPIRHQKEILGSVLIAYQLGDKFANDIKRLTKLDVALLEESEVIYSTLKSFKHLDTSIVVHIKQQPELKPYVFGAKIDTTSYDLIIRPLYFEGKDIRFSSIAILFSKAELLQMTQKMQRSIRLTTGILSIVILFISLIFARTLSKPITELAHVSETIAQGDLSMRARITSRDEIGALAQTFNTMAQSLEDRMKEIHAYQAQLKSVFKSYVSEPVAEEVIKDPFTLSLGGKKCEVTILFSDIRGFTTLSEKLPPDEVVSQLNTYFSAMIDIIYQQEGTLDKFMGDAILCYWGAPAEIPDHAQRALRCGFQMQEKLKELNEAWKKQGKDTFQIGIGINTGIVVAGNVGDTRKMEYTVMGDPVNLAQRLESLTKEFKSKILISHNTYEKVKEHITIKNLGEIEVKGKTEKITVYEAIAWK